MEGIRLIKDYLNSNLPVVVGVHYKWRQKINDGTVDHWVVIYGYHYGKDGIIFDYVNTNRRPIFLVKPMEKISYSHMTKIINGFPQLESLLVQILNNLGII